MNFRDLLNTRMAVKVEAKDNDLFCDLAEEFGFSHYPLGGELDRYDFKTVCYAHGFDARNLDGKLSTGSELLYFAHGLPVTPFTEFEEYFDAHVTGRCNPNPLNLTDIYS